MKSLYLLIFLVATLPCFAANVTIDTNVKYQTIMGYGSASWYPERISKEYKDEIIREYVFDMGINRLRLEIPGGNKSNTRRWEWLNDDEDPYHFNWENFNTKDFDKHIEEVIVPYRDYLQSIGKKLDLYVSPSYFEGGSTGGAPAWLINSPAEYAEHALSLLIHLKEKYNIEAQYYCILNEAGNNNAFTAKVVADMIRELGPRMREAGLNTRIQFPESISAGVAWNYIQATKNDPDIWQYIGLISYHLYGTNDPFRDSIRIFAGQKGIPTAQTEFMGLDIYDFYEDLVKGGVSYWEIYGVGSCMDITYERLTKNANFWNFRQIMHFVEPGSVRVKAESDDSTVKALAFLKDGKTTVVLIYGKEYRGAYVYGLPPGRYCSSYSNFGKYTEEGVSKIDDIFMTMTLSNAVLTIYPYDGIKKSPIIINWSAYPECLKPLESTVQLFSGATDPEDNYLTYSWKLKTKPVGANVKFDKNNSKDVNVSNITIPGRYLFELKVEDSYDSITKEIRFDVFDKNNPPVLSDVHNRIPVLITLPADTTTLRVAAWDLENDLLEYKWEIISQPAGADAQLMTPGKAACQVKNLKVAGDYIFRISVNDGTDTVSDELTVPVYPSNNAPVISGIIINPGDITLPLDSVYAEADVSDPDNDIVSYWWSIKTAPNGAKPVFITPWSKSTVIKNLKIPGDYSFSFTAADGTKKAVMDVKVKVQQQSEVKENSFRNQFIVFPNPFSSEVQICFKDNLNITKIKIYNCLGLLVKNLTVIDGIAKWDGTDTSGNRVAAGLYIFSAGTGINRISGTLVKE